MNYFISPVKYSTMFPGAYKKKNLKLIYMTLNGFLNFFPHSFNTMWPLVKGPLTGTVNSFAVIFKIILFKVQEAFISINTRKIMQEYIL